jgi:hypothetical protein
VEGEGGVGNRGVVFFGVMFSRFIVSLSIWDVRRHTTHPVTHFGQRAVEAHKKYLLKSGLHGLIGQEIQPLQPRLQPTPSPSLDEEELEDATPVPAQGDAILISLLD